MADLRCAHCTAGDDPASDHALIPIGAARERGGIITWVGWRCYQVWLTARRAAGDWRNAG